MAEIMRKGDGFGESSFNPVPADIARNAATSMVCVKRVRK